MKSVSCLPINVSTFRFPFLALFLVAFVTLAGFSSAQAATRTVENTNDSGIGSLRDAITSANIGDTIDFSLTLPAVITLTQQLEIDKELSIVGPGQDQLAINGNYITRVFKITTQGNAHLEGLTITHGDPNVTQEVQGGGIYNAGTLTVQDCRIYQNFTEVDSDGAGLYNASTGTATLTRVTIDENYTGSGLDGEEGIDAGHQSPVADGEDGENGTSGNPGGLSLSGEDGTDADDGDPATSGHAGGDGAGIYNVGALSLFQCAVVNNAAGFGGVGGLGGDAGWAASGGDGGNGGRGGDGIDGDPPYTAGQVGNDGQNGGEGANGGFGGHGGDGANGGLGGDGGRGGHGGGVYNEGTLLLVNTTISGNESGAGGNGGWGGNGSDGGNGGDGGGAGRGGLGGNGGFGGDGADGIGAGKGGNGGNGGACGNSGTGGQGGDGGNGGKGGDGGMGGMGGGICNFGTLTVRNCTIANNVTGMGGQMGKGGNKGGKGAGGAFDPADDCVGVAGGNAGFGGLIWEGGGTRAASGTAGEQGSSGSAGGTFGDGDDGLDGQNGNSLVSYGGGIYNDSNASLTIENSIIAYNTLGDGISQGPDLHGPATSNGNNILSISTGADLSGTLDTNQLDADPLLGNLTDKRGGLKVHPIGILSPATDAITAGTENVDQRGVARPWPAGGKSDIGAFELDTQDCLDAAVGALKTTTSNPDAQADYKWFDSDQNGAITNQDALLDLQKAAELR